MHLSKVWCMCVVHRLPHTTLWERNGFKSCMDCMVAEGMCQPRSARVSYAPKEQYKFQTVLKCMFQGSLSDVFVHIGVLLFRISVIISYYCVLFPLWPPFVHMRVLQHCSHMTSFKKHTNSCRVGVTLVSFMLIYVNWPRQKNNRPVKLWKFNE